MQCDPVAETFWAMSLSHIGPTFQNIARTELSDDMNTKVDESDIVQETFLKAHCDFDLFDGHSARELKAWLRQILLNSIAQFVQVSGNQEAGHFQRSTALRGCIPWQSCISTPG